MRTPGPWVASATTYPGPRGPISAEVVAGGMRCIVWGGEETNADATLIAAAPVMLEALQEAAELVKAARQYFPKSVRNSDRFQLENTCAAITKAIAKARGTV